MSNQSRFKLTLSILTLIAAVLAACAPAVGPTFQSVVATPLSPMKTASQAAIKPTLTLKTLSLQATPIIITTSTAKVEQEIQKTMTPQNNHNPNENRLVAQAKEDLAQRLSIPLEQIELVSMEAVTWPDGSLGCPEPGVEHIQIQREGTLIRLRVGKRVYQYHSGGRRQPFLCEHPSDFKQLPPGSGFGNE